MSHQTFEDQLNDLLDNYEKGQAGKRDNRSAQIKYHNDKLAWNAALSDRTQRQNEYNRANP